MARGNGAIEIQGAYTRIDIDLGSLGKQLDTAYKMYQDWKKRTSNSGGADGVGASTIKDNLVKAQKAVEAFGNMGKQSFGALGGAVQGATGFISAMIPVIGSAGTAIVVATGGIALLTAALAGLAFGATQVTSGMFSMVQEAESFEKAVSASMLSAKRFGYNLDEFSKAAEQANAISKSFSRTQIYEFMGAMTKTGASVENMQVLLNLFENNLKALPGVTVDASHALGNLTDFMLNGNATLLNEIGLGEDTLKTFEARADKVLKATGQMSNGVDKSTKTLIGMIDAMKDTSKMSDVMSNSLAENSMVIDKVFNDIRTELGLSFKPIFSALQQAVLPYLYALRDAINRIDFKKFANAAAEAIKFVANVVKAGVGFIIRFLSYIPGFDRVLNAFKNITKESTEMSKVTDKVKSQVDNINFGKQAKVESEEVAEARKKMAQVAKQIADEMYNYNKQLAQIADSHQKNLDEARKSLSEESAEFEKTRKEITDAFNESVSEIQKNHQKTTDALIADKQREVMEFEKSERRKRRDFERTQEETRKQNEKKLRDLKRQLERELSAGSGYSQTTVDQLRRAIDEQEKVLNAKLDEDRARFEEQMQDEKDSHNEKLSDIDRRIAEENAKYDEQMNKTKARYDADIQAQNEAYAKKREALLATIAEEEAFFTKHAETLKTIDRTRLLDEVEELKKSNRERIAELQATASEQTGIMQNTAVDFTKIMDDLGLDMAKIFEEATGDMGLNLEGFKEDAKKKFDELSGYVIDTVWQKIKDKFKQELNSMLGEFGDWIARMVLTGNPLGALIFAAWERDWFNKLPAYIAQMWERIRSTVSLGFDLAGNFGSQLKSAIYNIINALIDRLENKMRGVNFSIGGASIKPFEWMYIPRFYKEGGMVGGGGKANYVNFMNENGKKEGIQLPSGSMIFSYEDTKAIVNSLKQRFSEVKTQIPNLLSQMGINGNYNLNMNGAMSGGRQVVQEIHANINYPMDIKELAREMAWEGVAQGV